MGADATPDVNLRDPGGRAHGFWVVGARKLDAGCITDIARCATVRARYWAVDVAFVGFIELVW